MEVKIESLRNVMKNYSEKVDELTEKTEEFKKYINDFNKSNPFVEIEFEFKLKWKGEK